MIEVLVVDDNPIVRAALRGYLELADDVRVVAEAGNGREALAAARRLRPTVALLDHRMPIADGLSVLTAMTAHTSVLVITSDASDQLILAMLRGGARGYLVHGQFQPADVLRAVRAVAVGHGWLSPAAASAAATSLQRQAEQERAGRLRAEREQRAQARFGLTHRERQVLALLSQGLSNVAIARALAVTEKTVKNHLHHIFAKLGVGNRTEAVIRWSSGE